MSENQQLFFTLTSIKKIEYQFTVYDINLDFSVLKWHPAVYAFFKVYQQEWKWRYVPNYIWQTNDAGSRIPNHEKIECVLENWWTHLWFFFHEDLANDSVRENIEKDLLAQYQTSCNIQFNKELLTDIF